MGCVSSKPALSVPDSLLACKDAPKVPAPGAKARETGKFIVDLYDAHDDCHTKLGAVRNLVKHPTED